MRLRTWLLTGTSLGLLALAPLPAQAQSAELTAAYQAYVDAQGSGDAAAAEAALGTFTEQCIVAGFSSIDECVAALAGGGAPAEEPVAEEPAPIEEPVVEEPVIEEEQPVEEAPAVVEEQPVQEEAVEEEAAEEEAPAEEVFEEPAAEPEPMPEEQAVEEQPSAEEQPVEQEAPQQDDGAAQQQFIADLNAALADYQRALDQASQGGDFAEAQAIADDAESRILQLCTDNGYADIASCIGQELPALPQPAADEQAADDQAADEQPAEEPAAEGDDTPADAEPLEAPAPPPVDPMVEVQSNLATAIELYNSGIEQLGNGNADGQVTVDIALQQIAEACDAAGQQDVAACLEQFGFAPLAAVPQVEVTEEPSEPVQLSPAIDEDVTPEAVEALPADMAPEQAAPLLDSAKQDAFEAEQPTDASTDEPAVVQQPEEPAGPPPESDADAQSRIAPVEVQSVVAEEGEQISEQAIALAPAPTDDPLPQNVTIINNTTINNTVINNNAPSSPVIFQIGLNIVINNPEQERDRMYRPDEDRIFYEELRNGRTRETIVRPNGVRIVTVRNRWGDVLKRSRFSPDGREFVLASYDEDQFEDRSNDDRDGFFIDPGRELPPLRLNIPARDYILDVEYADEDEVELFFRKPPVEQVRRIYSIEEVKRSARIRDAVPRIEVGGLTFDSGKATISANQVGTLSKVAKAMLDILDENPAETFLIEGHTDAVGSDTSNLVLSDQRAAVVAQILADFYKVPPENLVTQGYGERFLKVNTQEGERLNRRVTIKRITPLITVSQR